MPVFRILVLACLFAVLEIGGALAGGSLAPVQGPTADKVVVEKSARTLVLFRDDVAIAEYEISLGFAPEGHKTEEGDGRTPEGNYVIDWRNPQSSFHLSLHISYPNAADRAQAAARGVPPGGDIFIHGQPNGLVGKVGARIRSDWTLGCIAVGDAEIEEIWALVPNGTPIEIRP